MPAITPDLMVREEEPGHHDSGPSVALWISEAGGLTQFGAFVQIMPPGARSAEKHWHEAEDEMVYVLDGAVTLHEGDQTALLRPGDAATFRAGAPVGHFLENRSLEPVRCLIVGTRAPVDRITYPDRGIVCHRDRAVPDDSFTDVEGNPVANPFGD